MNNPRPGDLAMHEVHLDAINKTFASEHGPTRVLENLSLTVQRGQLVTIVGPSGCGKTTLLRIIAGIAPPTSGTVWLHPDVSGRTAYLHQFPHLLPWRTLMQNASLALEVKESSIEAGQIDYLRELINKFDLSGFEDHMPHQLSGGMQQRVALIRAMAAGPKLLLCDEPFASIDFVNRLKLSTTFRFMCKVGEITTVMVTHNLDEAIILGDQVVVLSRRPGRIKSVWQPELPEGRDPIISRATAEFKRLFHSILADMEA